MLNICQSKSFALPVLALQTENLLHLCLKTTCVRRAANLPLNRSLCHLTCWTPVVFICTIFSHLPHRQSKKNSRTEQIQSDFLCHEATALETRHFAYGHRMDSMHIVNDRVSRQHFAIQSRSHHNASTRTQAFTTIACKASDWAPLPSLPEP